MQRSHLSYKKAPIADQTAPPADPLNPRQTILYSHYLPRSQVKGPPIDPIGLKRAKYPVRHILYMNKVACLPSLGHSDLSSFDKRIHHLRYQHSRSLKWAVDHRRSQHNYRQIECSAKHLGIASSRCFARTVRRSRIRDRIIVKRSAVWTKLLARTHEDQPPDLHLRTRHHQIERRKQVYLRRRSNRGRGSICGHCRVQITTESGLADRTAATISAGRSNQIISVNLAAEYGRREGRLLSATATTVAFDA
jgi:hypothetical protein